MIEFVKQPTKTSCGQTCIAMALGLPVEKVIKTLGHARATYSSTRGPLVRQLGGYAGDELKFESADKLPRMAIIRIAWRRRSRKSPDGYARSGLRRGGHAVLWFEGKVYDPIYGVVTLESYKQRGGVPHLFMEVRRPGMETVVEAPPEPVVVEKLQTTQSLVEATYDALPAHLECPKCKAVKAKDQFGVRVMKRDANGNPIKVTRQSYCRACR